MGPPRHSGRRFEKKTEVARALRADQRRRRALPRVSPGVRARPGPPQRPIGARRGPARGDRNHQPHPGGAGEPAHSRRAARVVPCGERRLQPGADLDAGHLRQAPRRSRLRSARQRSRRAGAVRRRHPRDLVGDRPPGARIHAVVRSAGDDPRWRAAGARHVDIAGDVCRAARAGALGTRDEADVGARAARSRPRGGARAPRRREGRRRGDAARRSRFLRVGTRASCPGGRDDDRRCRQHRLGGRDPGPLRRHAFQDRDSQPASRRFPRPDARLAVSRQPERVQRQEHEPAEVRRRPVGAHRGNRAGGAARRGTPDHHRAERRLRCLSPASRGCHARPRTRGRAGQSPQRRQGDRVGRRQEAGGGNEPRQAEAEQGRRFASVGRRQRRGSPLGGAAARARSSARGRAQQEPERPQARPERVAVDARRKPGQRRRRRRRRHARRRRRSPRARLRRRSPSSRLCRRPP